MSTLARFRRFYGDSLTILAAIALSLIVVCLLSQIVARSLFSLGLPWSSELARFAAVWAALLGAAAAYESKGLHLVDALLTRLSGNARLAADWLCLAGLAATLVFLVYYGLAMTDRTAGQTSSAMRISMAWVYVALPVAAALMSITLLADIAERLLRGKSDQ